MGENNNRDEEQNPLLQAFLKKKKPVEAMTERELLQELVKERRVDSFYRNLDVAVRAVIILAVLIIAIIVIPKIAAFYLDFKETMDAVQGTMSQIEASMDGMKETGEKTLENLDTLLKGLQGALGALNPFKN